MLAHTISLAYEHSSILYYVSLQMSELENLGYAAFAFGYFEDDIQFTSTPTAHCCASSQIIEYLHSVIVAGEYE